MAAAAICCATSKRCCSDSTTEPSAKEVGGEDVEVVTAATGIMAATTAGLAMAGDSPFMDPEVDDVALLATGSLSGTVATAVADGSGSGEEPSGATHRDAFVFIISRRRCCSDCSNASYGVRKYVESSASSFSSSSSSSSLTFSSCSADVKRRIRTSLPIVDSPKTHGNSPRASSLLSRSRFLLRAHSLRSYLRYQGRRRRPSWRWEELLTGRSGTFLPALPRATTNVPAV